MIDFSGRFRVFQADTVESPHNLRAAEREGAQLRISVRYGLVNKRNTGIRGCKSRNQGQIAEHNGTCKLCTGGVLLLQHLFQYGARTASWLPQQQRF